MGRLAPAACLGLRFRPRVVFARAGNKPPARAAVSPSVPPARAGCAPAPGAAPPSGGFPPLPVPALAAGMPGRAVGGGGVDGPPAGTGVPPPGLAFARLGTTVEAFRLL